MQKSLRKTDTNYVFISLDKKKMASGDISGRSDTLWS